MSSVQSVTASRLASSQRRPASSFALARRPPSSTGRRRVSALIISRGIIAGRRKLEFRGECECFNLAALKRPAGDKCWPGDVSLGRRCRRLIDDTTIFRAPVKTGRDRDEIRVQAEEVCAPTDLTQNAFRPQRASNDGNIADRVKGHIALRSVAARVILLCVLIGSSNSNSSCYRRRTRCYSSASTTRSDSISTSRKDARNRCRFMAVELHAATRSSSDDLSIILRYGAIKSCDIHSKERSVLQKSKSMRL